MSSQEQGFSMAQPMPPQTYAAPPLQPAQPAGGIHDRGLVAPAPQQLPAMPTPQPNGPVQAPGARPAAQTTLPQAAADTDVIEKDWVAAAKRTIAENRH